MLSLLLCFFLYQKTAYDLRISDWSSDGCSSDLCQYCMCMGGTKVVVEGNRVVEIEPDRENPFSWRDFCRKGKTAAQVIDHPQRLTRPMKRVGDRYVEATYEEAIRDIAARLNRIIERHGVDAVGSYSGNQIGRASCRERVCQYV